MKLISCKYMRNYSVSQILSQILQKNQGIEEKYCSTLLVKRSKRATQSDRNDDIGCFAVDS